MEGGRVTGVRTNKGHINCEVFVNCAGQVRQTLIQNNFVGHNDIIRPLSACSISALIPI